MLVAGVGLIGGSLALAARERGLVGEVLGFGRGEENLELARRKGIIDRYFLRPEQIPGGVDLLILALPVRAIIELGSSFVPALGPGGVVSDVGSVKRKIVEEMERLLPSSVSFVGAHPIAGGEEWGSGAASGDLFAGKRCILTPTEKTDKKALERISSLWREVGARVEIMEPGLHDRILAIVSHLPHVLAYGLVNVLGRSAVDSVDLKEYCAGGFKDLTRIASSRPELWRDICLLNGEAIADSLECYIGYLGILRRWIVEGRGDLLEEEFARANETRRQIP